MVVNDDYTSLADRRQLAFQKLLDDKKIYPKPVKGKSFLSAELDEITPLNRDILSDMLKMPTVIEVDELDQVYVQDGNGEKIFLTSDTKSLEYKTMMSVVCDRLPEVPYDLICDGYPVKQKEAFSIFKCVIISKHLNDRYLDEIIRISESYDFSRMMGAKDSLSFSNFLEEKILKRASKLTKVLASCCTLKCYSSMYKKDTSFLQELSAQNAAKLLELIKQDTMLNAEFNGKFERANNMKEKYEVGEELAKRRKELLSGVPDEFVLLFNISKITVDSVPESIYYRILDEASEFLDSLKETELSKTINDKDVFEFIQMKLHRRAMRMYLLRMKSIRYILWENGERENLIPKA